MTSIATNQTLLVVRGGISGMFAALAAAECVTGDTRRAHAMLGGHTELLYRYFPKM
jgi:quinone-modifying oxidoreductase subunit QmoA